jgi:hypothetical protein
MLHQLLASAKKVVEINIECVSTKMNPTVAKDI